MSRSEAIQPSSASLRLCARPALLSLSLPLSLPLPLVLSLTLVLTLSLAACGGGDSGNADPGPAPDVVADLADPGATPDVPGPADVPPTDLPDEATLDDAADASDPGAFDPGPVDPGPPAPTFAVVKGGLSAHRIVLEAAASPSEKQAAEDLRSFVLQATGADLPIVTLPVGPDLVPPLPPDPEPEPVPDVATADATSADAPTADVPPVDPAPMIVIGQGPTARSLGVDPLPADLGEQGFRMRAVPPHVVIAGTPGAGSMYGVHRFLEDHVGVRWIAPGETRVPQSPDLLVPEALDRLEQPAFAWRTAYYAWPGADAAYRAHMGDNSGGDGPDGPYGLQYRFDGQAHSYFTFVSPDEFFDSHPEYFSEIGGVRIREDTQLCLTNPDVLDIVTERMLARMAAQPGVRQHNFSQMDHYNGCECEKCRAMNELYGTPGGTQFWFVNELAKRTSAVHPDKQIGTLAYMYTEKPPVGLDMHPNVAVWLCHMYPSCDAHGIATCPENATYKARAEAWSKLSKHLYIWHYIVNFTHYYVPFPNFGAMAQDLRFYQNIGVEGIFLQGMNHAGGGGEFSLLRPYYGLRLLWDPDRDASVELDEFLDGYYRDAAPPIRDWIDLLQAKVDDEDIHMHLYTNPAQGYLPDDVVEQGEALFAEAAALAGDDEVVKDRVTVAAMPLRYARIFPRNGYRLQDGMLRWNPGMATFDQVLEFIDLMTAHGFTTIREAIGGSDTLILMWTMMGADQELVSLTNGKLAVDIVPALAGRVLRIADVASGKAVTAYDVRRSLFYPFCGGLEDRVGAAMTAMGWVEPAGASAVTATSATLTSTTFDGWGLVRVYTLDPVEPILRVKTIVTNPGPGAREALIRNHLELDLGTVETTRMKFAQRSGAAVDEDMTDVLKNQREGRRFHDQDAPAGQWQFEGDKGLVVTQSFADADVASTWVYSYPATLNDVELEVWSPAKVLQAGESYTVERAIRVEAK